jgi:hypothetical protein
MLAAVVHPPAAAVIALLAWLLLWNLGAIGVEDRDAMLRLFPLATRFNTWAGVPAALLAALAVTVWARGRRGLWLRRALGPGGLALLGHLVYWLVRGVRNDCFSLKGCDLVHAWVALGVLATASTILLATARLEAATRPRWLGLAGLTAIAAASAIWTHVETRTLRRYTGGELANVSLRGFFATSAPFVPSDHPPRSGSGAVPLLPMRGATMQCGGDWQVVTFHDRARCLPRQPLLALEAADLEAVELARAEVFAAPAVLLTLRPEAARRMSQALRHARSHRLVLTNARGELIVDAAVWEEVPGPTFLLTLGEPAAERDRVLRSLLGHDRV